MFELHNGDCLDVMQSLKDKSVNLILADLPYGTTACKWDVIIPLDIMWENFKRIITPTGVIVLTASMPFTAVLAASNLPMLKYEWIWEKPQGTNPMMAKKMPLKSHENVLVFYNKQPIYNPQMEQGKPYKGFSSETAKIGEVYGKLQSRHRDNPSGERYPKTILRFKQEKGLHPTQKPVPLFEYLINTYTQVNDIVLDPVMGSGTTGIACLNRDRYFIGIEKDKKYFNIAKNRIKEYSRELS